MGQWVLTYIDESILVLKTSKDGTICLKRWVLIGLDTSKHGSLGLKNVSIGLKDGSIGLNSKGSIRL